MRTIVGMKNIAIAWNVSESWIYRRRRELIDCGALMCFVQGHPKRKRIHGLSERFYAWAALKQQRGEEL